jgi:acyl dehydratase
MTRSCRLSELDTFGDRLLGVTGWLTVTQRMVDLFAEATGDHQWIHTDQARAADGPFGCTVAHGYLTMALVPRLISEILHVEDADLVVNKGIHHLRFATPVRVGSRVRAVTTLHSIRQRPKRFWELLFEVTIEVEGETTPALTAENVFLYRQASRLQEVSEGSDSPASMVT